MITDCIAAYEPLLLLQDLICALVVEVEWPEPFEIALRNNDLERSAKVAVSATTNGAEVTVCSFCQPRQNISLFSAKLAAEARRERITLIDDDEIPGKGWLSSSYAAIATCEAAGAYGPLAQMLSGGMAPMVRAIGFSGRRCWRPRWGPFQPSWRGATAHMGKGEICR